MKRAKSQTVRSDAKSLAKTAAKRKESPSKALSAKKVVSSKPAAQSPLKNSTRLKPAPHKDGSLKEGLAKKTIAQSKLVRARKIIAIKAPDKSNPSRNGTQSKLPLKSESGKKILSSKAAAVVSKKEPVKKSNILPTPVAAKKRADFHKPVAVSVRSATSSRSRGNAVDAKSQATIVQEKPSSPKRSSKGNAASNQNGSSHSIVIKKSPTKPSLPPSPPTNPRVMKKIRALQSDREHRKDLALDSTDLSNGLLDNSAEKGKDRIVLIVRDSYWLHATWDVSRRSVERVRVAMAEHWHTAHPILRLLSIDNSGTTNNAETVNRDIDIHGGVRNWYIDVSSPPSSFRILLGYIAAGDRFHELARSNIVTTPIPGSPEAAEGHWADISRDAERVFALSGGYSDERETEELQKVFEERLKRPMGTPALAQFGSGAESGIRRNRSFHFDLDAEMIVFGSTHPQAYVTLGGEPVKVHSDGTFSVRVPLPDRRQVLPATACTRDGVNEQTIVIAVERNTKVMEAQLHDSNEE